MLYVCVCVYRRMCMCMSISMWMCVCVDMDVDVDVCIWVITKRTTILAAKNVKKGDQLFKTKVEYFPRKSESGHIE